jgi:hypothetical protein
VATLGVSASIAERGLSRAICRQVVPEEVQAQITLVPSVSATSRVASAIASEPVRSAASRWAAMIAG